MDDPSGGVRRGGMRGIGRGEQKRAQPVRAERVKDTEEFVGMVGGVGGHWDEGSGSQKWPTGKWQTANGEGMDTNERA